MGGRKRGQARLSVVLSVALALGALAVAAPGWARARAGASLKLLRAREPRLRVFWFFEPDVGGFREGSKEERAGPSDAWFVVPVEEEIQWLADSFREDGSFCQNPLKARTVPYFANLAALSLLPDRADLVSEYVDWYLGHLNLPDRWGINGTIYDYNYRDGVEIAAGRYDSADSYASTFLGLVAELYDSTGDEEYIIRRLPEMSTVAGVLLELQDPSDGLIWALPNRWNKFLMDNCENYWGLSSFSKMLSSLDMLEEARRYGDAAGAVRAGIQEKLWNERDQSYFWSLNALGIRRGAACARWYPDAVSQLYPALFGVIEPGDLARQLYQRLDRAHPSWQELDKPDRFPWAIVAYASLKAGDEAKAATFVRKAEKTYLDAGRPYPWHSVEAAYLAEVKKGLSSSPLQ